MRLLFDTHVVIWALEGSRKLPREAQSLLNQDFHEHWVSAASLWEIAIKVQLGKLALSRPVADLEALIQKAGFRSLAVLMRHAARVADGDAGLSDPFDRLLLAQCELESLRLVSADQALHGSKWVIAV